MVFFKNTKIQKYKNTNEKIELKTKKIFEYFVEKIHKLHKFNSKYSISIFNYLRKAYNILYFLIIKNLFKIITKCFNLNK